MIANPLSRTQAFFVCAFVFLLAGCHRYPKLVDYPVNDALDALHPQKNLTPPIVVVATLSDDVLVARPIRSHWDPELILQLRKMRIHIENSLRGNVGSPDAEVFYFTLGTTYDGPPILGSWKGNRPYARWVLFLRRDSGALRRACDGIKHPCARPVRSGAHPDFRSEPGKPLEADLAEIYLTKGAGVSNGEFAESLVSAGEILPEYAVPKLRLLAQSADDENSPICLLGSGRGFCPQMFRERP